MSPQREGITGNDTLRTGKDSAIGYLQRQTQQQKLWRQCENTNPTVNHLLYKFKPTTKEGLKKDGEYGKK